MKEISLTQGLITLVDDEDYEWLNQYKWYASTSKNDRTYYALRKIYLNGKRTNQKMHRIILDAPKGIQVDHEDHNGLNNQKYNIRLGTNKQNQYNQQKQNRSTSSKYKGVCWHKLYQKWQVYISIEKRIHLGYFNDEIEAALAYDKAAIIHFGEFAKLNFPHASSDTQI